MASLLNFNVIFVYFKSLPSSFSTGICSALPSKVNTFYKISESCYPFFLKFSIKKDIEADDEESSVMSSNKEAIANFARTINREGKYTSGDC